MKAGYEVKKLFAEKKKKYFETKLTENLCKPKELCKTLKALGLPNKVSIAKINALKGDTVIKKLLLKWENQCYKKFHLPQTNAV